MKLMSNSKTTRKPSEVLLSRVKSAEEREAHSRGVEAARLRLELAQTVQDLREKAGLSQSDLAKRVGTRQPNISRLENGEFAGLPSLDLLGRVASALNGRLEVRIVRQRKSTRRKKAARKRRAARRR